MRKTILFQGDSVTDAGRFEERTQFLGDGYPHLIADYFAAKDPEITVINRGISGNRTIDLVNRWQEDCLSLKPDVLTILIGINDCWRKYDSNQITTVEAFEANYRTLLDQVKEHTNARIILMEPFVLPVPADRVQWRETLDPEIQAVRRLAMEYQTGLVTLDGEFAKAALVHGYTALCADGVHPTALGHKVIMDAWLKVYLAL